MRIGFDISHAVGRRTGLGSYAMGMLYGMARAAAEHEFLVYSFFFGHLPRGWRQAIIPPAPNFKLNLPAYPDAWLKRMIAVNGRTSKALWGNVDIIHSNGNTAPLVNASRLVFTLFDLTIYLFPETHTRANYDLVNRNLHLAARHASAIIAISEQTRTDIQRFLHVPDDRISVVYGAADERFRPDIPPEEIAHVKRRYSIRGDYILTVGTTEPRKNLLRMVSAFREVANRGFNHKLVIAGQRGWMSAPLYEYVTRERLRDKVLFTGYVRDQDLPALYAGAAVFAYPSLYEGFGLPVVEAMACGLPIITSNRSALPEVAGDAALLVDPEQQCEIADALYRLLDDEETRRELSARALSRSKFFSWERSAQRTLRVYEKVMNQQSG